MKLSIVTPCYNSAKYIGEMLESIHNGSQCEVEHIVVDGKSRDATIEIASMYSLAKLISESDSGQTNALNKGFQHAHGDVFAWQNADDLYRAGTLDFVAKYFEDNPGVDMIYGDYEVIDETGKIVCTVHPPRFSRVLFTHGRFCFVQPTVFWRRRVHEVCAPLDESLHYCMDVQFYCRAINAGFSIRKVDRILGAFRTHQESKTQNSANSAAHKAEYYSVLSSQFGFGPLDRIAFEFFHARAAAASFVKRRILRK